MRLRISKILSPLLLLPVLLPVFVVFLVTAKRENIRHEIKERLEKGLLHTIRVKNNEYAWVKPGKEIVVNGRMFDVKKQTALEDGMEFTGLFDEEETALNGVVDNLFQKQAEKNNLLLSQLVQLLSGLLLSQEEAPLLSQIQRSLFPLTGGKELPFFYRTIITPPPQS